MTAGAALGEGAYFGREFQTSQGYAGAAAGLSAVGIAELTPEPGNVLDFGWAITCKKRELVRVRYLLVSGLLAWWK